MQTMRWLGCALVIAACGGSQVAPRAPEPPPEVTVQDPGAEPRQVLRYELTAELSERFETTVKQRVRVKVAASGQIEQTGADLPTVRSRARASVSWLSVTGEAIISVELEDAAPVDDGSDRSLRMRAEREIEALRGWRVSWHQAPSGQISQIMWEPRAKDVARPRHWSYVDALHQAAVIFPDTPIGVGASWQVISERTLRGVTWNQTVTYRLQALADGVATIDADFSSLAAAQTLVVDPHGTTKLTSGSMTGTVRLIVPLHRLVATTAGNAAADVALSTVYKKLQLSQALHVDVEMSTQPITPPLPCAVRAVRCRHCTERAPRGIVIT